MIGHDALTELLELAACAALLIVLHFVTPWWWWVAVVPFAYGLLRARSFRQAGRVGFLAPGLVWLAAADVAWRGGADLIAARVAVAMLVRRPEFVLAATGIVAGMVGLLAALAGRAWRAQRGERVRA